MTATGWWTVAVVAVAVLAAASLPVWLPARVIALRERIFALVNGAEGIEVPGRRAGVDAFKRLYGDPTANGRSRGAALSDLFWYWLAPGPQVHQEHLEPGPRYDQAARATRRVLAGPGRDWWEESTTRATERVLDELTGSGAGAASAKPFLRVRLRDLMMPVWAEVYFEAVFGEPCPPQVRRLIVDNADDVVSALKCTRLRHMRRRDRLTRYLLDRVRSGAVPEGLPEAFCAEEKAWYLQGAFFNTAVVQMSEACAHVLLAIATHPDVQRRLQEHPDDTAYLDRVIDETLRVYPLFGIAHRITSGAIELDDGTALPSGSVLLFNYAAYQHAVPADGAEFDPDRWEQPNAVAGLHHIPFGVSANRPCPARGIAPPTLRAAARVILDRFELASSAGHTRSMPNRGPCLLLPRSRPAKSATAPAQSGDATDDVRANRTATNTAARRVRTALALMRVRDRWEDVARSLVQLVLGAYMVWDARRQGLCRRYFAEQPPANPPLVPQDAPPRSGTCPVARPSSPRGGAARTTVEGAS